MFDSTKEDLVDLLKRIKSCKLQLPDFQRDWVWADDDIRSLLASVAKGYPIGAILTLSVGGVVSFKPRVLASVKDTGEEPAEFLLDGQQRLTSLYQSFYSDEPVVTKTIKGRAIKRFYYIDIQRAVDPTSDDDDLIIGVPADRVRRENFSKEVRLDLSSKEGEFDNHMFPLNQLFDEKDWIYGWREHWRNKGEDFYELEKEFDKGVLDTMQRYKMPIICLDQNNSREAICIVFEKVNTGGKKLDAFELLTAVYAADRFNLREDWIGVSDSEPGRLKRLQGINGRQDVFKKLQSTDFLQSCTVLHTYSLRQKASEQGKTGRELPAVSCKRDSLLGLPLSAYQEHADAVEKAFHAVGKFLNGQKIIWHRDVPYPPQSVALASAFALLGRKAESAAAQAKFRRWLWSGVLGELYGSSTESRIARDVPELVQWIGEDGPEPWTVSESIFQIDRLDSLRIRLSAAYKGLHALLMREGCLDFITGNPVDIMTFFQESIDIHHIFPRAWCEKQGIDKKVYNSIINKTPLSSASNKTIGGRAPSKYLEGIQSKQGLSVEQLDDILRSHLIDPELLRTDNFEAFYENRKKALADLIEKNMEKPVVGESIENEPMGPEEYVEEYEEDYAEAKSA